MNIQFMPTDQLIREGVSKLNEYLNNGQWPQTLANGSIVADTNRDKYDRISAAFRIIEDIESIRWGCTNPNESMDAYLLSEHFREIHNRIRQM